MKNSRFFLKNVATTVAFFAVCIMLAGCGDKPTSEPKGTEALFETFSFTGIDGKSTIDDGNFTITAKAKISWSEQRRSVVPTSFRMFRCQ